jgi:OmpA-OmpF porin, OOP family
MRLATVLSRDLMRWGSRVGFALALLATGRVAAQAAPAEPAQAAPAEPAQAAPAEPAQAAPAEPASVSVQSQASGSAEAAASPAAAQDEADALAWELAHRAYNTFEGSTGSIFLVDPGMAQPGSVRVQLALDSYSGDSFLYDGDDVEQNRQFLSVSWTALDLLEMFASIQNRATVADLPAANSLHAMGDIAFGAKLRGELSPMWRIGGGIRFGLLNDIGEQETMLDATNIGLTGAVALDLQRQDDPIPLIFRFNVDYLFDNSAKVLDDVEDVRYRNLDDADDRDDEVRHLITRVERFGLGVNRVDMLTLGLGLEVPIQVGERFFLHPMVDYRLGLPVNRQGYDCAFFSSDDDRGSIERGADDTCIDDAGFDAFPMSVAFGARFVPPVRGLSVLLGVDIGLGGTDTFVRELQGVAPFRLLLALGYDYDARPQPKPAPPPAPPPPPPPPPPTGRLLGKVVDQVTGGPIANAIVAFANPDLAPVATDESGRFMSYELEPGDVELALSHPDYEPRRCGTTVPSTGGQVQVACSMTALPSTGSVKGTVRDVYGSVIAGARIQITGPGTQLVASDAAGEFTAENLPAGDYEARAESSAHLTRVLRFSVQPRQQTQLDVALVPRPARSGVELRGGQIQAASLRFIEGSSELDAAGAQAVAEITDLLLREPALRRVRIAGDGGEGLALGRALAIKQRLVDAGVAENRLEVATEPAKKVTLTIAE